MARWALVLLLQTTLGFTACRALNRGPVDPNATVAVHAPVLPGIGKVPAQPDASAGHDHATAGGDHSAAFSQQSALPKAESSALDAESADPSSADCPRSPPVIDCCVEPTPECHDCRATATLAVAAWQERCGEAEPSCAGAPSLRVCCDALLPSCESCKERNKRLFEAWSSRCRPPRAPR